jgi:hypothetical protein
MRNRQSLTKLLMFLLPAIITVAAYTTFYDSLFGTPKCENCDNIAQSGPQHNAFDLRRILDLIDQLRQNLAAKEAYLKYAQRTPLDLAFLKDKLETFRGRTGAGNDLKSETNQEVDDSLSQEKPLVIAKIDEKNIQEEFEDNPPEIITIKKTEDKPAPPFERIIPPPPIVGDVTCTICPPPPCPQNMPCIPENNGEGPDSSAVPLPTSAYFLLSGLFIVFITRFRKSI